MCLRHRDLLFVQLSQLLFATPRQENKQVCSVDIHGECEPFSHDVHVFNIREEVSYPVRQVFCHLDLVSSHLIRIGISEENYLQSSGLKIFLPYELSYSINKESRIAFDALESSGAQIKQRISSFEGIYHDLQI